MTKVSLRKCPVCGDSYGSFTNQTGKHALFCKCDKAANLAEGLIYAAVIVGISLLVLVQFEKNMHLMKNTVDLLKRFW